MNERRRARRSPWILAAVAVGVVLVVFGGVWTMRHFATRSRDLSISQWVESESFVFLSPPRSDLQPGDVVKIRRPVQGRNESAGPLEIYQSAGDAFGSDLQNRLRTSRQPDLELSDSIAAGVRAGALQKTVQVKLGGSTKFTLKLTDVQIVEAPLKTLQDALAAHSELLNALKGDDELAVVSAVLRPGKLSYHFESKGEGSGQGGAKTSGASPDASFESGAAQQSDVPVVLGYRLAYIHLDRVHAGAPAEVQTASFAVARAAQGGAESKLWPVGATLTIRFLNGTPAQQAAYRSAFAEWLKYANLNARYVDKGSADVRVNFGDGSYSFLGVDGARADQTQPSTTVQVEPNGHFDFRLYHEIGHVLGLVHETSNPAITMRWNIPALERSFGGGGNLQQFTDKSDYPGARPFDRASVMLIPYVPEFTLDHLAAIPGPAPSDSDRRYIASLYPGRRPL